MEERIIILGSNGQIGSELAMALRQQYGKNNVITSDIKQPSHPTGDDIFECVNVLDIEALETLIRKYKPTQIYLLAAMLSATGERKPKQAWQLNIDGLLHVLDLAVKHTVEKVFWPSSIAVFGPHSPKENTPQYCIMDPNTVYGFSKLAGERWCEYYFNKFGLDVRSIRYPGLISWKTTPGGGTTDYASNIFHKALTDGEYECYLSADIHMPMLYMDDAIQGTLSLMNAPSNKLRVRSSYNITGFSFSPKELTDEIQKYIPSFKTTYLSGDPRQAIAESWPSSIDDSFAREDWDWRPQYTISSMTSTMLKKLQNNLQKT